MTAKLGTLDARQLYRLLDGDPLPPEDGVPRSPSPIPDRFYRAQAPRLLRFFSRRGEKQDAADLVSETFVRFVRAERGRAEPLQCPEAYLSQVGTNLLRNRARAAFLRATISAEMPEDVADPNDLLAALEARDLLNRIQTAMMRLSPKTREIFLAHRIDGATYAQIADRTGLSTKTVEWHMAKAIRHLHRSLGSGR